MYSITQSHKTKLCNPFHWFYFFLSVHVATSTMEMLHELINWHREFTNWKWPFDVRAWLFMKTNMENHGEPFHKGPLTLDGRVGLGVISDNLHEKSEPLYKGPHNCRWQGVGWVCGLTLPPSPPTPFSPRPWLLTCLLDRYLYLTGWKVGGRGGGGEGGGGGGSGEGEGRESYISVWIKV